VERSSGSAAKQALADLDGKSIAHDFEAQARTCFALIDRTLNRVGGKLADLVTMTVSISDPRYGDRFIKIRHELFPDGKFHAASQTDSESTSTPSRSNTTGQSLHSSA
jgi:2-iminobutanoate/2-iminopropanoate deaminase